MRLRKILSLALALCLLMTLLPLQTFAAAEKQTDKQAPLYANLKDSAHYPKITIQEVEPDTAEATEDSDALWEGTKTYAPTYLTVEEAALKLRENMKARKTSFDIYVQSADNYNQVVTDMLALATVHTGKPTEGDYLLWHLGQWGGTVESEPSKLHYKVEMTYYTTAAQEAELTTAVNSLLKTLNVKDKSDYEKVKAVYNYICQNVTYDYEHLSDPNYLLMYTAYGALINKTSVCQGYATLLYRLLLELGVDCRVITGQVLTGEAHAWNIAKLGNVYYNLDATWDSEMEPDTFFLRNSVMNVTHYRYMDYMTTQFHKDYPISETDYAEGVEGVPEYYFIYGTCGEDAYWAISRDGKLTIGGTGDMAHYSYAGKLSELAPWTSWYDAFDTVIIEEGITSVGINAFYVSSIKAKIVSVTLPESLKTIGYSAFEACTTLKEINLPESLTYIGPNAFKGCLSLTEVTIAADAIESYAFAGCNNLRTVELCDGVTHIGTGAFDSNYALESLTIPASVTRLENSFVGYCSSLKEIRFIGDAPQMADRAFEGTGTKTVCYYPENNATWTEDVLQNYGGNMTWIPYCSHKWSGDSCDEPRFCTLCGEAFGQIGHVYDDGVDGTCNICGIKREETEAREVVHMFRMYNPNTGEHFYTGSEEEKQNLIGHGWHYEGVGFTFPANTGDPVHRLFQPSTGEHLYTMDVAEKDRLMAEGWNYEGIAFNSAYDTEAVQHRLHNPNATVGAYHFTFSEEEKQTLIDAGWEYQGIGWYSCWK